MPDWPRLAQSYPPLSALNRNALRDPRVRIAHQDASTFLERETGLYDVILADLPDPNTDALAKLYAVQFYRLVRHHLSAAGIFVTQATSPLFAREAFWCIAHTVKEADLQVAPYHAYIPSFGEWGFVLASRQPIRRERAAVRVPTRFLTDQTLPGLFAWTKDTAELPVDVSTLDRPVVLQYYLNDWKQWE